MTTFIGGQPVGSLLDEPGPWAPLPPPRPHDPFCPDCAEEGLVNGDRAAAQAVREWGTFLIPNWWKGRLEDAAAEQRRAADMQVRVKRTPLPSEVRT